MSLRSTLIGIAVTATAFALSAGPTVAAEAATTPWSAIPGTTARTFIPEGTFCPGGKGNDCLAVGWDGQYTGAVIESNSTGTWQRVPTGTPQPDQFYASYLYGVSCSSHKFCAAVGNAQPESNPETTEPIVATLKGGKWSFQELDVSTQNAGYIFTGVSCPSTSDCVAVGRVGSGSDFSRNLVARYDGRTWTATLLPNPGSHPDGAQSGLTGISCPSTKWCAASGYYSTDQQEDFQGFTEVLDGKKWTVSETPILTGSNALFGIDCPAKKTCVAVGDQAGQTETLAERLAGKTWSVQGTPMQGQLRSVGCASKSRCAAAGYNGTQPLVMTYARKGWSSAALTNPLDATYNLAGVSCASKKVCIAAGWGVGGPQHALQGYLVSGSISR